MVKLGRGVRRHSGPGRQDPVPLFPPGELPVFGPPPVNMRRPMPPPRGPPMPGGYVPSMSRPRPPLHHMRHNMHPLVPPPYPPRRPPHPPPLRPLLQTPVMPPRPLPFMRGGRGPVHLPRGAGHIKRLGKNIKKSRSKKNKTNKDNNKDGEHFCETCDRGWDTEEKLKEHLESHVTCGLENCSFTAHPKVVAVHVKLQHQTGLFKKIAKNHNKEDIEKWRAERRRNYPTKENVERKVAEKSEMEQRGERLTNEEDTKLNKKLNKRGPKKFNRKRKRVLKSRGSDTQFLKKFRLAKKEEILEMLEAMIKPESSESEDEAASSDDAMSEGKYFSDDEWKDESTPAEEVSLSGALSALISMYASDDPSDDEPTPNKSQKIIETPDLKPDDNVESIQTEPEEAPEEVSSKGTEPTDIHMDEQSSSQPASKERKSTTKEKRKGKELKPKTLQKPNTPIPKQRITLLSKLLQSEIRKERNQILQCVRYVVENHFFGIGQGVKDTSTVDPV